MNKAEHYYTENPTSDIIEKDFEYKVGEVALRFTSVSGVFGHSPKVDSASRLLIENIELKPNTTILDIGCGFGPIGLSIKALNPSCRVTMIDVNNRALEYTRKNMSRNRLEAEIVHSDLFSELGDRKFDYILTNPPIAMGKPFLTRLIQESKEHLNPNGALFLVAFHNKGGSTLKKIMQECYSNAEDIAKGGGIRVYKSTEGR